MRLLEYMKALDTGALDNMAGACSTTVGQLRQVAYGNRRASAALAIAIDRCTEGSVPCEELRPDIDWKYLRGRSATETQTAVA